MTMSQERLRGSLHPDTAHERLDYWQGLYRARTAAVAADEATGAAHARGGIGPALAFPHGRIEHYLDQLIAAQIAFARFQIKERARDAASAVTPAAPADHTAESERHPQ